MNIFPNIDDLYLTHPTSSAHARNQAYRNNEDQGQETSNDSEKIRFVSEPAKAKARKSHLFYKIYKTYENISQTLVAIDRDFIQECSLAKLTNRTYDGMTIRNFYCITAGK